MALTQIEIDTLEGQLNELGEKVFALNENTQVDQVAKDLIIEKYNAIQDSYKIAIENPDTPSVSYTNIRSDIRKMKFEILREEYKKTLFTYSLIVVGIAGLITLLAIRTKKAKA